MSISSTNPADSWFGRPPPEFAKLPPLPRSEPASQLSDVIINDCLNLEASGEIHEAAAKLRLAAASDPGIIERFNATRRVLGVLETQVPVGPDLTSRIIAGVDERRPFLPRRTRRRVSATRLIAASGVLAALGVAALVQLQPPTASTPSGPTLMYPAAARPQTADAVSPLLAIGETVSPESRARLTFGNAGSYAGGKWGSATDDRSLRSTVLAGTPPIVFVSPTRGVAEDVSSTAALRQAAPNAAVMRPLLWDASPLGLEAFLGLQECDRPPASLAAPLREKAAECGPPKR